MLHPTIDELTKAVKDMTKEITNQGKKYDNLFNAIQLLSTAISTNNQLLQHS